jgi:hypothetical protein
LQSVYLYNELLAAHGPAGLLRSQHVHTALQILAAHLLQRLGGRTPIELLPGDQTMLGAGVRVGVMVILLGQAVGCEAPLLGELALAGLLHHSGELGPVDDDVRSGAAILRCARRAVDLATAPGRSAADVVRLLAAEATAGSLPRDLVAPCADLLQVVVPVAPD